MKTKLIPLILMLTAGAVASIVTYMMHYEIKASLWILVAVLVSFYIAGVIIKGVMDSFLKEDTGEVSDEGEVIEKEAEEENGDAPEMVTPKETEE